MPISRKETAWKKSRKFGDVKGGRRWPILVNKIFNRQHSLERPCEQDELPIFIRDNPSRDFYYPIEEKDIREHLNQLPSELTSGITHIWLHRTEIDEKFQGMFISGSGVNLLVLNAFPKDLRMNFGNRKPTLRILRLYSQWTPDLFFDEIAQNWYLQWTEGAIKDYFLNGLLLHELGHFVDRRNLFTKTNKSKSENFADVFAIFCQSKLKEMSG
jgi:hypothetical protein